MVVVACRRPSELRSRAGGPSTAEEMDPRIAVGGVQLHRRGKR